MARNDFKSFAKRNPTRAARCRATMRNVERIMAHRGTRKTGQKPKPKAARKTTCDTAHRPIRFGEKLITIYAEGQDNIPFVIHEDLLCSSSGHFKKLFQKSRKAIKGECSICIEDLSGFLPVCYCKSCGQNFHTKCLDDWLQRKATCPMCHVDRPIATDSVQSRIWDAANGEPWDAYMQWLYTGVIPVHLKDLGEDNGAKYCQLLMDSYKLGERLEDELFQKAAQKEIVEDVRIASCAIGYHNVGQVYQLTNGASTLRKVLVDMYISQADSTELGLEYPQQFILDIARALLARQTKQNLGSEKVLAGYSSEKEDNDTSSEDEEDESSEDGDELAYDVRYGDGLYEPGETVVEEEEEEEER
ncbi:hypothetical protein BM1_05372 [Bipolaris maydis]|nr:hypothetical protein BM1_05372 [Bipolaris maydis]KAJ6273943.1 hypothetical protein PSV08DRAFT_386713 [Bipolaris maydis]